MSDELFNEVPVVGNKYSYGDWKLYARHNNDEIAGFFGEYRWLSNFESAEVWYEGHLYPSPECAYQAAKVIPSARKDFRGMTSAESKKAWRNYTRLDASAEEWDARKFEVMALITFDKYWRHKDLRAKLTGTGEKRLIELNHWHDSDFGWCVCSKCAEKPKLNMLGRILMNTREYFGRVEVDIQINKLVD